MKTALGERVVATEGVAPCSSGDFRTKSAAGQQPRDVSVWPCSHPRVFPDVVATVDDVPRTSVDLCHGAADILGESLGRGGVSKKTAEAEPELFGVSWTLRVCEPDRNSRSKGHDAATNVLLAAGQHHVRREGKDRLHVAVFRAANDWDRVQLSRRVKAVRRAADNGGACTKPEYCLGQTGDQRDDAVNRRPKRWPEPLPAASGAAQRTTLLISALSITERIDGQRLVYRLAGIRTSTT